ncbi:PREDICTED: protein ERGIC-53-like [Dipodomys ordii]|uniref:Protein ERGIC-53-like n=1 Tax=Dipodomys ordii TaxID=10020 RepID=A0A1S3ETW1_DIPOR|nr:PREDICTED: protein ERGIC-53-like [Dipodomys ordii]
MPGLCTSAPLLCLLLLCPAPHGMEELPPLRRRFEYKLSFKGPWPGAGIPFWSCHGDAIVGLEEVRLAPSMRHHSGAVWSSTSVPFSSWEVEVRMRVTGPGARGAQGVDRPAVRVLGRSAPSPAGPFGYEDDAVLGSCHRDFRNRPHPFKVRITYWGQRLRVSLSSGLTPRDPDEVCVDVGPLVLAPEGFFGVSAATSTLADDHDILSFLTFSLHEPGLEAGLQAFLDMEQLRLARQLEELTAQLALGTRASMAQPDFKAQEEGERLFDLEETLDKQTRILQSLRALSKQMAQAEKQWREQMRLPGQAGPVEGWDLTNISTLLTGQRTLLSALQEVRDAAVRTASDARGLYLPVGTKHHFLELDQIVGVLQKDLRGLVKMAAKAPCPAGRRPGAPACLQPGFFLFFLLLQTIGFFCYVNFRQELDQSLRECLSTVPFPLDPAPRTPAPRIPGVLGLLRRQPVSSSMNA